MSRSFSIPTRRCTTKLRREKLLPKMVLKSLVLLLLIRFNIYTVIIFCKLFSNVWRSTTVAQRNCRFPHESNLKHFEIYTKSFCMQECRLNLVYKKCKCIPHFYPNRSELKTCRYITTSSNVYIFEIFYILKLKIRSRFALTLRLSPVWLKMQVLDVLIE